MADPTPDDHPLARLVLDYIRALSWPAMVLLAFVAMRDDIMKIVNTREVEIAGALKIGKSIDDLESKAQAEIDDLKRMVAKLQAEPQDPGRVKAVTAAVSADLEALERNIGREVARIRVETAPVVAARPAHPCRHRETPRRDPPTPGPRPRGWSSRGSTPCSNVTWRRPSRRFPGLPRRGPNSATWPRSSACCARARRRLQGAATTLGRSSTAPS